MPTPDRHEIHDRAGVPHAPAGADAPDFHDVRNASGSKLTTIGAKHHDASSMHDNGFEITGLKGVASGQTKLTEKDLLSPKPIPEKFAKYKAKADEMNRPEVSMADWFSHGGDTLANKVVEGTKNGGIMLLGPYDTMRDAAKNYKDPDGYCPVFTHASASELHLYYGVHQSKKKYGVETLAKIIEERVPPDQPIRLLGCESGVDQGLAVDLTKRLPGRIIFAPNGYCELKDGRTRIYKQKPSEVHFDKSPEPGVFVRIDKN